MQNHLVGVAIGGTLSFMSEDPRTYACIQSCDVEGYIVAEDQQKWSV